MCVCVCVCVGQLCFSMQWVRTRAGWRGEEYTSWVQREEGLLHAYKPTLNTEFAALEVMIAACCPQGGFVWASPR